MVILTRRPGEELVITNAVRLTVVSAHGGFVRLGVDSPNSRLTCGEVTTTRQGKFGVFYSEDTSDGMVNLFQSADHEIPYATEVMRKIDVMVEGVATGG